MESAALSLTPRRILLVDDEPLLLRAIRLYLELHGFAVSEARSGEEALASITASPPDLVILDVLMPGLDGFQTLEAIRQTSNLPVIMLTAYGEEDQKVRGLALGADDYMTKPFSQKELVARIQAVLRRASQPPPLYSPQTAIEVDERLTLDFDRAEVWLDGQSVHLTATEFKLLYQLASNPGRLMPTATLLSRVWGSEYQQEDHYVRLYVSYLRQKLEPDPSHPRYILTVPGMGYKFVDYRRKAIRAIPVTESTPS